MRTPTPSLRALLSTCAAAVVLIWASTAGTTTVLKMGLEGLVANSDRIVVGTVESIDSYRENDQIFTKTTVRVEQNWKGSEAAKNKITIRQPGGRIGDMVTRVHGMPNYRQQEQVLVFLQKRTDRPGFAVTGLRQGKFSVAIGPDGSTKFVVPRLGEVQLLEPDPSKIDGDDPSNTPPTARLEKIDVSKLRTAEPAPVHETVIPLKDFRERVENALGTDGGQP